MARRRDVGEVDGTADVSDSPFVDSKPAPKPKAKTSIPQWATIVISVVFALLLVGVVVVGFTSGAEYWHGLGESCLFIHNGLHMHVQCGSVSPPSP
jgi:hypothetical protein